MRGSLVGSLIILATGVGTAQTPAFYGVGDLPGGTYSSNLFAVSADGRVAVGWSSVANGSEACYRLEDLNLDGCVNNADLLTVLFEFGATGYFNRADVNYDGTVNNADLLAVLFAFGSGC